MSKCNKCVDGLVVQGESIKTICKNCSGTGNIIQMDEEIVPVEEEVTPTEESFLEESGEESVEVSPEEVS